MVTNYPMRERSPEELQELAFVTRQRKTECSEVESRNTILGEDNGNVTLGSHFYETISNLVVVVVAVVGLVEVFYVFGSEVKFISADIR